MALTQIPQPPLRAPWPNTHTCSGLTHCKRVCVRQLDLYSTTLRNHVSLSRKKKNPHFDRAVFDVLRSMRALSVFHCSWELTGNNPQTSQQLESKEHMGMNIDSINQIYFNHATLCQAVGQTSAYMERFLGNPSKSVCKTWKPVNHRKTVSRNHV